MKLVAQLNILKIKIKKYEYFLFYSRGRRYKNSKKFFSTFLDHLSE